MGILRKKIQEAFSSARLSCDRCEDGNIRLQDAGLTSTSLDWVRCPMVRRECNWSQGRERRALLRGGFGEEHIRATISGIKAKAREIVAEYLANMGAKMEGQGDAFSLFVQATRGWGKTSILRLIAGEAFHRGISWRYRTAVRLGDDLCGKDGGEWFEEFVRVQYLMIDDLGECVRDYPAARVKELVDARWKNHRPICATTALSDTQIASIPHEAFKSTIDRLRDRKRTVEIIASSRSRRQTAG